MLDEENTTDEKHAQELVRDPIEFQIEAEGGMRFRVRGLTGTEGISKPYRFELDLISVNKSPDFKELLQAPARLIIRKPLENSEGDIGEVAINGILASFEQLEGIYVLDKPVGARYRAVLVPRMWRLSLITQSRVFTNKTVKEIIQAVLKPYADSDSSFHYEIDLDSECTLHRTKREHTVQYQESDLNFLSRILEEEGIFFLFQDLGGDKQETLIITDKITRWIPIQGSVEGVRYDQKETHHPANLIGIEKYFTHDVVSSFTCRQTIVPEMVTRQDHNFQRPEEIESITKIRAEEVLSRERLYSGVSTGRSFRAGHYFKLKDHYRNGSDGKGGFNREYTVIDLRHQASQEVELGKLTQSAAYQNEFVAIPDDALFRPERRTSRPRISGTMNGQNENEIEGGIKADGDSRIRPDQKDSPEHKYAVVLDEKALRADKNGLLVKITNGDVLVKRPEVFVSQQTVPVIGGKA